MTPTLRSLRLILHHYTPMLVSQQHVDWLNNQELMFFSEQRHYHHSLKSQLEYTRCFKPCDHVWVIRCGSNDVGTITAHLDDPNSTANMGILLAPESQGQGFGTEAWTTVMEWLFSEGIRKVEAGCREDNWAMRRLALNAGMTLEAEIPGHFRVGDSAKGMALYGRFAVEPERSEWAEMWREPFWKPKETVHASSSA